MKIKLAKAKPVFIPEPKSQAAWLDLLKAQTVRQNISTTGHVIIDKLLRLPTAPLDHRIMSDVIWLGDVDQCQLCDCKIEESFVDGVVKGQGWALMCIKCHKRYGNGLGLGRGQKYVKAKDGDFHKEEQCVSQKAGSSG